MDGDVEVIDKSKLRLFTKGGAGKAANAKVPPINLLAVSKSAARDEASVEIGSNEKRNTQEADQEKKISDRAKEAVALQPEGPALSIPRPVARTFLILVTAVVFFASVASIVLGARVYQSDFWAAMNNPAKFSFNFQALVTSMLIIVGTAGVLLVVSTAYLLKDP